jgi:hypothetical protein
MRTRRLLPLLAAALLLSACHRSAPATGPAPSIRHADFANFQYRVGRTRWTLRDSAQAEVRRNGIVTEDGYLLDRVVYGDVTGDGREDALVIVEGVTGGSAVPHWVFAYAAGPRGPRRLWAFETGDRAAGGLKDVYARDGMLVVELYGQDKLPTRPRHLTADDGTGSPACCPTRFTRSLYAWKGRRFGLHGTPEVLPYDPSAN